MKRIPYAIVVALWFLAASCIMFGVWQEYGLRIIPSGEVALIRGLIYLPLAILVTKRMSNAGRGAWVTVLAWLSLLPVPVLPFVAIIAPLFYPSGGTVTSSDGKRLSRVAQPMTGTHSERDIEAVAEVARRVVEVVNESIKLANESTNPETKVSRLGVAKQKLTELKQLGSDYPFLTLASVNEVEQDIARLELEFELAGYRDIAEGNTLGQQLEKAGQIDEALSQYERLLEQRVDTPFTYRRLAILYRKRKQPDDELRAIRAALDNVPSSNASHYAWFQERLAKLERA